MDSTTSTERGEIESSPIEKVGIGEGQVIESGNGCVTKLGTPSRTPENPDPRVIGNQAERRGQVERLMLSGYSAADIAEAVGAHVQTVERDIEYIRASNAARPGAEELRSYVVRTMLDLAETARGRYREGESTVEGRLIVDALARLSKVTGLDESVVQEEVGGALARFLDAMTDRATDSD